MFEDTIVAPSTPPGKSAIAVIRLSGEKAFPIALKIFHPEAKVRSRKAVVGKFYDAEKKFYFDEGLMIYYPAPRSYTGEDVVELSCHGNQVVVTRIVELCVKEGARLAKPGEFTYRAFLNGKMDLLQAEAVADLVDAVSYEQVKLSFAQLEGNLSRIIEKLREKLINVISLLETEVEFPDEGITIERAQALQAMKEVEEEIRKLLSYFDYSRAIHDGVSLVITGKANVGKSSLFNALLEENRAIVTEIPGTTRDFLRERIVIQGIPFILTDTAGFHPETRDAIEVEGIRRTQKLIEEADGIIFMVDGSQPLDQKDLDLAKEVKRKKTVIVINKIDLPLRIKEEDLLSLDLKGPVVKISALKHLNLDELRKILHKEFVPETKPLSGLINIRQKVGLEAALSHLQKAKQLLQEGSEEELALEELREVALQLESLTGKITPQDLLVNI